MATIYDLKPKFQNLLRPVVRWLARIGITANQITLLAMFISFVGGALIAIFPEKRILLLMIPVVLFIRMALNAIDGMLAREHNMKTALGAILNELGDVLSDVALYLPLALIAGTHSVWLILVVIMSLVSEMAGMVAVQIGAQRRYDGPMGKSDRAFVFGVSCLLLGFGLSPEPWFGYLMMLVLGLLCLTVLNRSRRALRELS